MKYSDDKTFCAVYPFVLKVECGYVNNPHDSGGPTMWGVAWNYNIEYLKRIGVERDTIQNLTREQAVQLYYDKYWVKAHCNQISDAGLAYLHFDTAVNCGVGKAIEFLNKLSVNPFFFDGSGDNNETLFLRLVMEYEILRIDYYTKCRDRKVFLEGWINRMEFVMTQARKLV